jgi:hypothetical protein
MVVVYVEMKWQQTSLLFLLSFVRYTSLKKENKLNIYTTKRARTLIIEKKRRRRKWMICLYEQSMYIYFRWTLNKLVNSSFLFKKKIRFKINSFSIHIISYFLYDSDLFVTYRASLSFGQQHKFHFFFLRLFSFLYNRLQVDTCH